MMEGFMGALAPEQMPQERLSLLFKGHTFFLEAFIHLIHR